MEVIAIRNLDTWLCRRSHLTRIWSYACFEFRSLKAIPCNAAERPAPRRAQKPKMKIRIPSTKNPSSKIP